MTDTPARSPAPHPLHEGFPPLAFQSLGFDLKGISGRVVPWLIARRRAVLLTAAGLALAGTVFSVRLYSDLRSELEELLPDSAPSVVAARTLAPKLHSIAKLVIDMRGSDPDGIDRFINALAPRLRALPPNLVAQVSDRAAEEESFVRRFGGLFLTVDELVRLRDQIATREAWERERALPLRIESDAEMGPPPRVELAELEGKYESELGGGTVFRDGYYQTPDGKLALVEVRPPQAALGLKKNRELLNAVKTIVASLNPRSFDPTLEVGYSGDIAELVEEQESLISDLALSTAIVVAGVLLVLWFYYRLWVAVLAVLGPLAVGCAISFGISDFLVGHLNANTAFLGSIVLGNGINPGIILVARYLEERRRGFGNDAAMRRAWGATLPATFVASFGAGLAYLSLAATSFRGFSQFGVIGGLGMALCWVATYLLAPPLLAALDGRGKLRVHLDGQRPIASAVAGWVLTHTRLLRVVSVVVLVGSIAAIAVYPGDPIEYDWTHLRSRRGVASGSVKWSHIEDTVWHSFTTPVVLWSPNPSALDHTVSVIRQQRAGSNELVEAVRTIHNVLPQQQDEKLPILAAIRDRLSPSLVRKLPPDLRHKAEQFRPPQELRAATLADLPASWRSALSERDGSLGHIAAVLPKNVPNWDIRAVYELKRFIRKAVAAAGGGVLIYSQVFLMSDINEAIYRDGPRATLLAFGLVCALVFLVLRQVRPSLQVIASLIAGVVVLVGVAATVHAHINFLNFVVLPISFGIGVDYAINVVQRMRADGAGTLRRVLSETGGAVALCSATTVVGYGSLWFADNRALAGFGLLAAFGEITCLSAALVLLPAWLEPRIKPTWQTAPDARPAPPVGRVPTPPGQAPEAGADR